MRVSSLLPLLAAIVFLGASLPATAEILGLGGKCLDLKDEHVTEGASVVLNTCKDNDTQQWTPADGKLVGPNNLCLAVAEAKGVIRLAIVATCTNGVGQQWTPSKGRITQADGNCLEAIGNPETENIQVTVGKCNGSEGQRWLLQ